MKTLLQACLVEQTIEENNETLIADCPNFQDDQSMRSVKWNLKTTLRSHLDVIRAMQVFFCVLYI